VKYLFIIFDIQICKTSYRRIIYSLITRDFL